MQFTPKFRLLSFFPGMMYLYCTFTVQCKMYTYVLLRYTDLLGQLTMIFNPSLLLWVVSVLADTLVSITAKKLSTSWNNFILGLSTAHGIFLRRWYPHNFPCSCFDTRCLFLFLFISLFLPFSPLSLSLSHSLSLYIYTYLSIYLSMSRWQVNNASRPFFSLA